MHRRKIKEDLLMETRLKGHKNHCRTVRVTAKWCYQAEPRSPACILLPKNFRILLNTVSPSSSAAHQLHHSQYPSITLLRSACPDRLLFVPVISFHWLRNPHNSAPSQYCILRLLKIIQHTVLKINVYICKAITGRRL